MKKLILIPAVAILLAACGGTSDSQTPSSNAPTQSRAVVEAQRVWDTRTTVERGTVCEIYLSQPDAVAAAILTSKETYKDWSMNERQEIVDALFVILKKEC